MEWQKIFETFLIKEGAFGVKKSQLSSKIYLPILKMGKINT